MIGETIGNFKIVSEIGRGGMGEVYLAENTSVGTRVAIKVLQAHITTNVEHVQRLFNEARAVERVQHPGTVRIFDVGHHDGRAYLVMEYLIGESLAGRIRSSGRMAAREVGAVLRQLAAVLQATHAARITHRDLKPDNIYLVPDKELGTRVKVLDFGIAKLGGTLAAGGPKTVGAMGTPAYMAPEQWNDAAQVDGSADVYAIGCIAFEMVSGRPPFVAETIGDACRKHLMEVPVRLSTLVPDVPARLDELVACTLLKEPAARPRLDELARELAAIEAQPASTPLPAPATTSSAAIARTLAATDARAVAVPATPTPVTPTPVLATPTESTRGPRPVVVAAVIGALLVAAAVIVYVGSSNRRPPPAAVAPSAVVAPSASPAPPSCPSDMVFVPAGSATIGSPLKLGADDEHPKHEVTLAAYCVDKTEVTVAAWARCASENGCVPAPTTNYEVGKPPAAARPYDPFCNGARDDRQLHPVNCVDWNQATAFCAWAGKRLPSEAEWEHAARGSDGRAYPWGDDHPNGQQLDACGPECVAMAGRVLHDKWSEMYDAADGFDTTAPVGSFPSGASPFGALDMAGNVAEWTADAYAIYGAAPDPKETGDLRVARGGAWNDEDAASVRATKRYAYNPALRYFSVGFRCARDAR